jgi:hypothetical protein
VQRHGGLATGRLKPRHGRLEEVQVDRRLRGRRRGAAQTTTVRGAGLAACAALRGAALDDALALKAGVAHRTVRIGAAGRDGVEGQRRRRRSTDRVWRGALLRATRDDDEETKHRSSRQRIHREGSHEGVRGGGEGAQGQLAEATVETPPSAPITHCADGAKSESTLRKSPAPRRRRLRRRWCPHRQSRPHRAARPHRAPRCLRRRPRPPHRRRCHRHRTTREASADTPRTPARRRAR